MLTRARTWYSLHAVGLAAVGVWAAGLGLAAANALQLSASSGGVETSEMPSDEAVPGAEESTATAKVAEPPAVFLPEDTIVAHKDSATPAAAGAAQMQKPTG